VYLVDGILLLAWMKQSRCLFTIRQIAIPSNLLCFDEVHFTSFITMPDTKEENQVKVDLPMQEINKETPPSPTTATDPVLATILEGRVQQPLDISIQNIRFSIPISRKEGEFPRRKTVVTDKQILGGITASFKPGRLTAVMGASGAGKTSLLNVLSGEITAGTISGNLLVNGEVITTKQMKDISGFVFQDDVILGKKKQGREPSIFLRNHDGA
jgi:ABC-type multidrug transport system fused ATPase/permease subunit